MRDSAITISASYTQHSYTAQMAGHVYMHTPKNRYILTCINIYTCTHIHTETRAAAAASILCPRPQLTVLRFCNLTIGVLGNVIHTRFLLSHRSSFIEATAPGYPILIELLQSQVTTKFNACLFLFSLLDSCHVACFFSSLSIS